MSRPPVADVVLSALAALLTGALLVDEVQKGPTWYDTGYVALHVGLTTAVLVRSTHRRASFTATYGLLAAMSVLMYAAPVNLGVSPVILCAPLALYKVARHDPTAWGVSALLLGVAGSFVSPVNHLPGGGNRALIPLLILGMVGTYLWATGRRRTELAYEASLDREREAHEHDAADRVRQAQADERVRIAREVHDIVAHSLAVVNVQAGTALAIGGEDQMRESLTAVRDSSKTALAELRSLVGVLREGVDGREVSGDLGRLPDLVEEARRAGVVLESALPGDGTLRRWQEQASAPARLAVVRVVQEALSNVIKHGGTSPQARLSVDERDGAFHVEVSNTARGQGESLGYGLAGLRERVTLTGGRFEAGPNGDGFAVRAQIPARAGEEDHGRAS